MITNYVYKKVDKGAPREGVKGTGVRLRFHCSFCKARFRSSRERVQHAPVCKEKEQRFVIGF